MKTKKTKETKVPKLHTFEVKQRKGSAQAMSGATTEIFMDGEKMMGVTKVTFEVSTGALAKITFEVLGKFRVLGQFADAEFVPKGLEATELKQ